MGMRDGGATYRRRQSSCILERTLAGKSYSQLTDFLSLFVSKKFQPTKEKTNSLTTIEFVKDLGVNGHE